MRGWRGQFTPEFVAYLLDEANEGTGLVVDPFCGSGTVLQECAARNRAEVSGGFRLTTNNRMEIYAAIAGLELLRKPCKVTLHSDSQYLVKAMREGWVANWKKKDWWRTNTERPENVDLWQRLDRLCATHQVEFHWVKGHAGNRENEVCDRLAMTASRMPNLPADDGYENKPESEERRPDLQEGQPCWKCSAPVIKQTPRKKPKGSFYYEFYLLCPNPACKTSYTIESAKRTVEQPPPPL